MIWQDKGYLLNLNNYNENSSIAEFYTLYHGKKSGIIFGSSSKKRHGLNFSKIGLIAICRSILSLYSIGSFFSFFTLFFLLIYIKY